ncbi:MAG TPA: Rho termination factor N-terminal domain-containing protein, partial [Luteimonas sp.]|nr:Rho termination factor N-terminal domain-containing protein [Luteimonas sp.]
MSDDTPQDSGDNAEKRVRRPRAPRNAEGAPAASAPAPAPAVPAAPAAAQASAPSAPPAAAAPPPPASDVGNQPQHDGGNGNGQNGNGQQGGGNDRHGNNNNRRDRFRNRRDRQRDRFRDDGLPRDDNGAEQQQQFQTRPANIPEDFPQYSLGDLKRMPAQKLLDIAEQLGLAETVARARKQDVIFALLKVLTRTPEGVAADGVLEILPDGFGFLRAAEASYLAGPDDTYISPSQIRRFNLRTGDHLSGRIRWPKDG